MMRLPIQQEATLLRRSATTLFALTALATAACTPPEKPPETRTYNFHALAGMSMGAIGTAWLAGDGHTGGLDAIAMLGGPVDAAYFLNNMERNLMGGFCPLEELEALAKEDPTKLNDPKALNCEAGRKYFEYELPQNYNHWRFTQSGGAFDRDSYLNIFEDLSLAIGNPLSANPLSAVFPVQELNKANHNSALCMPGNEIVIEGMKQWEYNPEGKYNLISFCDGQSIPYYCDDEALTQVDFCSGKTAQAFCADLGAEAKRAGKGPRENPDLYFSEMGRYDPCQTYTRPVTFGLAVDINGNGKRDFHEPVVTFGRERFEDVGSDGCANDKEDGNGGCTASGQTGDPNGDDFDLINNPLGTEGNFMWDPGEPFDDFGLDGVADTGDFGEGDGKYTDGPHRARFFQRDLRERFKSISLAELDSLNVYMDGGIRDVFNLGLSGDVIHSALRAILPDVSRRWTSFLDIPTYTGDPWERGFYNGLLTDYDKLGRNVFVRFGSDQQTPAEIRDGAGDHVGTIPELAARFETFQKWLSHVWDTPLGEPEPMRSLSPPQENIVYFSEALKANRNFGLALPPGYDDPENADKRYPVFMLGHGYGMDSSSMSTMQLLFGMYMEAGDLHQMIIAYPSGRCCFTRPDGSKDCREDDENGEPLDRTPGYVRECIKGNFYQNRVGYEVGKDTSRYGDSIFEIFEYIDKNYRVLEPMTVEVP